MFVWQLAQVMGTLMWQRRMSPQLDYRDKCSMQKYPKLSYSCYQDGLSTLQHFHRSFSFSYFYYLLWSKSFQPFGSELFNFDIAARWLKELSSVSNLLLLFSFVLIYCSDFRWIILASGQKSRRSFIAYEVFLHPRHSSALLVLAPAFSGFFAILSIGHSYQIV